MKQTLFFYLIKRLFLSAITLAVILFSSYALLRMAPGDPTRSSMLGENASAEMSTEKGALARNDSLRKKLHLDEPLAVGFYYWFKGICRGDLGESASVDKGRPVADLIRERLGVTLSLNFLAVLLTYSLAIPLGIFSAVKSGTLADRFINTLLFFLYSLPVLWSALMLQAFLCKGGCYPVFPLKGILPEITPGMSSFQIVFRTLMHGVLPVICLSYASLASLSRFVRSGMLDTLHQDYIRTARAKGLEERRVIGVHAMRNVMILLITLFAGLLPSLISGSILLEYVFNIPGMGSLSMMALSSRDIPLLMALFGMGGVLTLLGLLIADILYVFADPRINFNASEIS